MNFLALLFLFTSHAHSQTTSCKDDLSQLANAPVCPKAGLLSDLYPTAAIAVSESQIENESHSKQVLHVPQLVASLLKSTGNDIPTIFFSGSNGTYQLALAEIDKLQMDSKKKDDLKKRIVKVGNEQLPFIQDYGQSTFDPKTGAPVYQQIKTRYPGGFLGLNLFSLASNRTINNVDKSLASALTNQCGVAAKKDPFVPGEADRAYAGGNIEGGPGGICLVGRAGFTEKEVEGFATAVCGKNSPVVEVRTRGLGSGHLDELVKVIKLPNQKAPCDYAFMVASPEKGLELLKKNSNAPLFDLFKNSPSRTAEVLELREYQLLCEKIKGQTTSTVPASPARPTSSTRSVASQGSKECDGITQGQFAKYLAADENLVNVQKVIQNDMNILKNNLTAQMKKTLPQCETKFVDVPDLFEGRAEKLIDGSFTHKLSNSSTTSIFPNPTNSIQSGSTVLLPDTFNATFRGDIDASLKQLGLKTDYIDTLASHHSGGNLHCVTQSFYYCKPLATK